MQIANHPDHRIVFQPGKERRRKQLALFYKYLQEDVTIVPTVEYERLRNEIRTLETQLKMLNELRQAEMDRRDIHRPC